MIGDGGHAKQLVAEGASRNDKLVAIGDNRARKKEAEAHAGWDGSWDTFVSFAARFYGRWTLGEGSQVLSGVVVGSGARIGRHCIINHGATINHDVTIGDFVHVAPGAQVLGGAQVGEGCFIGANAVVLPNSTVPAWVVVRACSVWPCDYQPIGKRKVKCAS